MPVLSALLAGGTATAAQDFGHWWWDASVSAGQRKIDRRDDGAGSDSNQTDLRILAALNGYLGHPALGDFRVGADLLRSRDGGTSNQVGFDVGLNVLPGGAYPVQLFARRLLYDFSRGDGTSLAGFPDTLTTWGGRFRAMRGPFKGLLVGLDNSRSGFVDDRLGNEVQDHQFLAWSRAGESLNHSFRLERRLNEFALSGLEIDDWTVTWDERGTLGESWRWDMSTIGISRDADNAAGTRIGIDNLRTRNRFVREIGDRNQIDLQSIVGKLRRNQASAVDSYSLSAAYRWNRDDRWQVAPHVAYGLQTSDGIEVRSPRIGLTVSWHQRWSAFDASVVGGANYGVLERKDEMMTVDESRTGSSLSGTVGHGDVKRLRKELELELSRNELHVDREFLPELPGLGLPENVLGQQDYQRARIRLSHAWDSKSISGWGEWSHRETTDGGIVDEFAADTFTANLQFNGAGYSFQSNAGLNKATGETTGDDRIGFYGLRATWHPTGYVSIHASRTGDSRDLRLAPDIEGSLTDIGVTLRVGLLDLQARAFREESSSAGLHRIRDGFSWSLTRRFVGWLPVVTGTQRRGVIR